MAFGIPNLLNGQNLAANSRTILLSQAEGAIFDLISANPTWGVFVPGSTTPAVDVDSVIESDTRRDNPVSDYVIETGSFSSYNKVRRPGVTTIRLSKGGTIDARNAFLSWLEQAVNSITVYDIYWPEGAYQNYTLSAYRVTRSAHNGAAIIYADCVFIKIRESAALYYNSGKPSTDTTNAASPDDLPVQPTQRVQGIGVTATNAITSAQSAIQGTINKALESVRWP